MLNNKSVLFLYILLISLLISSCATSATSNMIAKHPKKLIQVNEEFKRWQEFQIEGITEVEYKIFVFRKNFVIQKNKKALRLDLLDSGIFGLAGSNLSVYADSSLQVNALWGRSILDFKVPDNYRNLYLWGNNAKIEDFEEFLPEIIEKNEFTKDGVRFLFNTSMRLKLIEIDAYKVRMDFNYDYNGVLSDINVYLANLKICNLKIDKISYNNINVSKLK